ncbi:MAG: tetraacyldisaccharide 4'-kinase [Abditibacteriaceae bacterium]
MLLRLLESIYAGTVARRRERCLADAWHPTGGVKVLSVGNLTMGGTGKTPAVQWLAKRLTEQGKVVIVARGYGGSLSEKCAVVSDGESIFHNSAEVGDEALLHARALPGVPVVIGKDRVAAVEMAVEKFAPQYIILDDAFQYWSLARDFNLVLMDASRPFDNGHTIPLGKLREMPQALERADAILLTRCAKATTPLLERTRKEIASYCNAPIFLSDHRPVGLRREDDGATFGLDYLKGQKVFSISAIADNAGWGKSLRHLECEIRKSIARRDHHLWKEKELGNAAQRAKSAGATLAITTEKDAVKIKPEWCEPLPLFSLRIELNIENERGFWQEILKDIN